MFWTKLGHGAAAGAAGVTTLNAITYLDMAVRARPASDTPSQAVEHLARKAGTDIPGQGDDRDNRLAGLGPLAGIMTGAAVGVAAAFARRGVRDVGRLCVIGRAEMAAMTWARSADADNGAGLPGTGPSKRRCRAAP